jgi:hypothetical protein
VRRHHPIAILSDLVSAVRARFPHLGIALTVCAGCATDNGGSFRCTEHEDCAVDPSLDRLGRCAPKEFVCNGGGTCDGWCAQICSVAREDTNPCDELDLICNEPRVSSGSTDEWYCQAREVTCLSVDDCPKYRPSSDGDWTCSTSGICRFPGYRYAAEASDSE